MPIYTRSKARSCVQQWKKVGKVVVFTNGCFDLLHRGHVEYLADAKGLGDKLVLGLNDDSSTRKIKGDNRPLQSDNDRAIILNALRSVDIIVIFSEETPLELIKQLKPDILVKGGDYEEASIIGAKEVMNNGGEVKIVPFRKGYGTSLLFQKIQEMN